MYSCTLYTYTGAFNTMGTVHVNVQHIFPTIIVTPNTTHIYAHVCKLYNVQLHGFNQTTTASINNKASQLKLQHPTTL